MIGTGGIALIGARSDVYIYRMEVGTDVADQVTSVVCNRIPTLI